MLRVLVCAIGLILGTAAALEAQSSSTGANGSGSAATTTPAQDPDAPKRTRLMLGVDVKQTMTPGPDTSSHLSVGFAWRWRGRTSRTDDRFAFAYRFSSFSSQISSAFAGQQLAVGDAKLRPLMAGVEYKMPRGKWTWSAGVTGGWSLNRLRTTDADRARLLNTTGSDEIVADLHNSLAFSPRVKGWYDLNRRVSFMVESGYMVARPLLTMRAAGVESSRRLNADAFIVKAGFVYGVW